MALVWHELDLTGDADEPMPLGDPAELVDAAALVADLVHHRPSWHQSAACRGQGPAAWFPPRGKSSAPALGVCGDCPVRSECLVAALEVTGNVDAGIWGGTSRRERRRLRRSG